MYGAMGLAVLYVLVILGIAGFVLHLLLRFVKAVEKIARVYERKHSDI